MIPELSVLGWLLHALSATLAAYFGFWVVRAAPGESGAGENGPRSDFRHSRALAFALLVCSVGSGATLLGMGEGVRTALWVGAVGAGLLGVCAGAVTARRRHPRS